MADKPSDFFVGVVDLFSILLPGSLLTFLIHSLGYSSFIESRLGDKSTQWAAFLISSYVLGHFLFAIGSKSLDKLYDETYKDWNGTYLRKLISLVKPALRKTYKIEFTDEEKYVSWLNWAMAFVRLQSPSAATEIDRLEADSKFFRSLSTLILIATVVLLPKASSVPCQNLLAYILLGLCFLFLSLWRFMKQRLKRCEQTYEFFIALTNSRPIPSESSASNFSAHLNN